MELWIANLVQAFLAWVAIPQVGLTAVFAIAFVSATLLPMGSEPAVFGLVKLQPELFWPAVLVATLGNTLGGALTWWMGVGARRAAEGLRHRHHPHEASAGAAESASTLASASASAPRSRADQRAMQWLARLWQGEGSPDAIRSASQTPANAASPGASSPPMELTVRKPGGHGGHSGH